MRSLEAVSCLHFIRHAETDMAGRFCGHTDPELNQRGREQAGALQLQGVEHVYSSDLRRAITTAEALGLPVTVRPALREMYFGEWEGLSWEEIERAYPEYARIWMDQYPALAAPGGESFEHFHARVLEEVHWLLGQTGPLAVVTHAGVLRVVLQHWHGYSDAEAWRQTQPYCCVFTL
jgi:broad specificity phosphatase PhoE